MPTLAQDHDCLLLDLDGTVFRGHAPTEGAVQALAEVAGRTLFVTNNASRGADEVAAHLRDLGFAAAHDDVVTSAQSGAHLLSTLLEPASPVLVVGTQALADEVTAAGLRPVHRFTDDPVGVIQGLSTAIGWSELAEAALAIRAGAVWVATNVDRTLPTERGLLPGNGALVAALQAATDVTPQVAGKPAPTLMADALARGDFRMPLVVGDRMDTDIEAANAAGLPSLMVLTGVSSAPDAVHAVPAQRPTYLAHDLRALHRSAGDLAVAPQPGWRVETSGGTVRVRAADDRAGGQADDGLSVVRAVAHAVWQAGTGGRCCDIEAADDTARAALQRWSLLSID